jgi:hypothetical protein
VCDYLFIGFGDREPLMDVGKVVLYFDFEKLDFVSVRGRLPFDSSSFSSLGHWGYKSYRITTAQQTEMDDEDGMKSE